MRDYLPDIVTRIGVSRSTVKQNQTAQRAEKRGFHGA
jgi:hypothetical protein